MNYKRAANSLRRIANKVLTQDDLAKQIIIQKGNTYRAFDKYDIAPSQHGWQVSSDDLPEPLPFNTAKIALAWCIAYKVSACELADTILWLDNMVTTKQIDIDILTHILDNDSELDNRTMLVARLMEDINSRQHYKKQLSKSVSSAKYIKLIGTNNEFKRSFKTGRRKRSR